MRVSTSRERTLSSHRFLRISESPSHPGAPHYIRRGFFFFHFLWDLYADQDRYFVLSFFSFFSSDFFKITSLGDCIMGEQKTVVMKRIPNHIQSFLFLSWAAFAWVYTQICTFFYLSIRSCLVLLEVASRLLICLRSRLLDVPAEAKKYVV